MTLEEKVRAAILQEIVHASTAEVLQIRCARAALAVVRKENDPLIARITEYLGRGGLFNPECMDHQAVSSLLIDCRAMLAASPLGKPGEE